MTSEGLERLKAALRRDEGSRLRSYNDVAGNLTIGVGHNITAHGVRISKEIEDDLLEEDMARAILDTTAALPWATDLDEPRQRVLYNMTFNLGIHGLLSFVNTLKDIEHGYYTNAADKMLDSLWARQVGPRATRLAATMRTGKE